MGAKLLVAAYVTGFVLIILAIGTMVLSRQFIHSYLASVCFVYSHSFLFIFKFSIKRMKIFYLNLKKIHFTSQFDSIRQLKSTSRG